MSEIQKGVILTLEGAKDRNNNYTKARVQNMAMDGCSSMPITIPWYLRGEMGQLQKGTEVAFAVFNDSSGIIISRMDGNWNGIIEEKNLEIDLKGNTCYVKGQIESV